MTARGPRGPAMALPTLLALLVAVPATGASLPPLVGVCWDYGCDRHARVVVPAATWAQVRQLFTPPARSPADERERIARAVAALERGVGRLTGTAADYHGNVTGAGLAGQMDCIDESRNTTSYLHLLAQRGLLRWHDVGERAYRVRWIFDQHWTATVAERGSRRRWAVDSWFLDNGHRPYVQRLDRWRAHADLPANPGAEGGRSARPGNRWDRDLARRKP